MPDDTLPDDDIPRVPPLPLPPKQVNEADLVSIVSALVPAVHDLTVAVNAQAETMAKNKVIEKDGRDRLRNAIIFFAVVFAFVALIGFVLVKQNKRTIHNNEAQALAGTIANCAYQNILRIAEQDKLTRMQKAHALTFKDKAAEDEFYEAERKDFQLINCKAFAPKEDQLKVHLDYPTTIPPPTGR